MRVETVTVKTDAGPVNINKTDYDPNIHTLANPEEMPLPTGIIPAAPLAYDANGNPVNQGDGGQFIPASGGELKQDGPTVAEYVAAGYQASAYPPTGYASRSTPEEIAAAVAQASGGQQSGNASATAKGDMLVQKTGKKFFIVDRSGNSVPAREGIDADGYKTDKDAWDAIMALPA